MNIKRLQTLALLAISPTISFAQADRDKVDPTTLDRGNQPPSSVTSGSRSSANAKASDAGAQRPIFLKTQEISTFGGFDSKIYYDDNPFRTSGTVISQYKDAIWSNTAYLGAGLGQVELTDAVITPYVGASLTDTEYMASGLDFLDYRSTNAYIMANIQHSNGWAYRVGVSYSSDYNDALKQETYSEFYPNLGVMKVYSHTDNILGIFNVSVGYHESTSFNSLDVTREDDLDNFDIIASYGLKFSYSNLSISPTYAAVFKSYTEGAPSSNNDREDLIHSLNVRVEYAITNYADVSLFGGYSKRDTKNNFASGYDFVSGTIGLALGVNFNF